MQGLFSFCSDTLLEGDVQRGLVQVVQVVQVIFKWFSKLLSVLKKSGCLSEDESVASCEELTTHAVDARAPSFSEKNAEDIPDIVEYLLADYSFFPSHGGICYEFLKYVALWLSASEIVSNCFIRTGWMCSYSSCAFVLHYGVYRVMSPCYKQKSFFTKSTIEAVRDAIRGSRAFLSDASFDPWAGLLSGDCDAFVKQ